MKSGIAHYKIAFRLFVTALALMLTLAGCGGGGSGGGVVPVLQSITLTPANLSMGAGQATQFTAIGAYSDGTMQNITASVGWSSSNTAVATINTSGAVFGVAPGTVTIGAVMNTIFVSTTLTVANYSVGGTQSLLPAGASVTLLNNGVDSLVLSNATASPGNNVPFYFNTPLPTGATYNVTVSVQPTGAGVHPCTVLDGIGAISTNFITSVQVVCGAAVGTLAGAPSFTRGFANGTAAAAAFNFPRGVAVDSAGNVYVADLGNLLIRKVTPTGVTTTLAGTVGVPGYVNATGTAASFGSPSGVAVDTAGNVYVADSGNNAIRKITPAGAVSTFAGSSTGVWGFTNGTGTGAAFNFPNGVAVDAAGNVYVADTSNNAIRKITSAGVVSTLATGFNMPLGVAVDSAGNVYVADTQNNVIKKVTSAGAVSILAGDITLANTTGGFANGTGTAAKFGNPATVAVDAAGNVYVADWGNSLIRLITPAGVVSTLAGVRGNLALTLDGSALSATFACPYGVAVDSANNVYVGDNFYNTIRKYTP